LDVPTGYDATFAGNLYWSTGGIFKIRYHGPTFSSLNAWRTSSGKETVGSMITGVSADPLLNNVGASQIIWPLAPSTLNGYHTGANSPAVNTALDLNTLFAVNTGTVDFFTTTLPASNQRDIGAFEKGASSTSTEIPTPTVVAVHNYSLAQVGSTVTVKTTDISEAKLTQEQTLLYPNPITRGEYLNFNPGEAPYQVELFTISGTLAVKQTIQEPKFYVSDGNLVPGIYIIKIIDGNQRILSGKIIVR
jgi:hypothetical protein